MLLRVCQVIGGARSNHPLISADAPLHVCLATAARGPSENREGVDNNNNDNNDNNNDNNDNVGIGSTGEISSVGRRDCTITIMDDKCVSRKHASIRLLSLHHDKKASALMTALNGDTAATVMDFGIPTTTHEIQACQSSPTGTICIVQDLASKFGTFVSVEEPLLQQYHSSHSKTRETTENQNHHGDHNHDTGEETDDEADGKHVLPIHYVQLTEKQTRAVQLLSTSDSNHPSIHSSPQLKFQKLEPNQSMVLLPLSHHTMRPNIPSSTDNQHSNNNPQVIILFGPQGSAISLTLIPFKFSFSHVPTTEQTRIISLLHYIGASHSAQWDVHSSTHLVTTDRKCTAKYITAWACRKPVVTVDYVLRLLARTSPKDSMPQENDFSPPGQSQLPDLPIWDSQYGRQCCEKVLKGYRMLILLQEDETAPLAESAGANILHLPTDHSISKSKENFVSWWKLQVQRARDDKVSLVVMSTASRRVATYMKWLSSGECGTVRFTNQKNLAKAITCTDMGTLLLDTSMVSIEKPTECEDETTCGDSIGSQGLEGKTANDFTETEAEGCDTDHETMPTSSGCKRNQGKLSQDSIEKLSVASPSHKRQKLQNAVQAFEENPVEVPARQQRSRKLTNIQVEEDERDSSQRIVEMNDTTNTVDDDDNSTRSLPEQRIPLPTTDDGWLVAAPFKRKNYRNVIHDLESNDEDRPKFSAQTSRVCGLIVQPNLSSSSNSQMDATSRRWDNNRIGKKDFKCFRKNYIIRGYSSFTNNCSKHSHPSSTVPTVRLISVLPKETELQRQMEMQQKQLEKEQEFADALFNDGGGIRGFRQSSSQKRGRVHR